MALILKIGVGAGLVTGVVGLTSAIAYSTSSVNSNTQISELLRSENKYALLSTVSGQDATGWTEVWKQYQKDNKTQDKDKWSINGWQKEDIAVVPEAFKSACSTKKDIKVPNDKAQEYIDFTKYCARPKTLKEVLEGDNFKALVDNDQNNKWKSKIDAYKDATNQLPQAQLQKTATQNDFNTLKTGCEKALALKTTDDDYSITLEAAKAWCGSN